MSFESFFKKPIGRDVSEEEERNMQNLVGEKTSPETNSSPLSILKEIELDQKFKDLELYQNARLDLIEEIKHTPTLSKIINNPEQYIDDNDGSSVEDIQKWINELDKEIYLLSEKIKTSKTELDKILQLEKQDPYLN